MQSPARHVLALSATLPFADGGASIAPGTIPTTATLSAPPSHSILMTTGTMTVAAADVPWVDGGTPGITGAFALSNDGFSMTGTFSAPYCFVSICGTEVSADDLLKPWFGGEGSSAARYGRFRYTCAASMP